MINGRRSKGMEGTRERTRSVKRTTRTGRRSPCVRRRHREWNGRWMDARARRRRRGRPSSHASRGHARVVGRRTSSVSVVGSSCLRIAAVSFGLPLNAVKISRFGTVVAKTRSAASASRADKSFSETSSARSAGHSARGANARETSPRRLFRASVSERNRSCPRACSNVSMTLSEASRRSRLTKRSTPRKFESALPSTCNCVNERSVPKPSNVDTALRSRCKHRKFTYGSKCSRRTMPRWCR